MKFYLTVLKSHLWLRFSRSTVILSVIDEIMIDNLVPKHCRHWFGRKICICLFRIAWRNCYRCGNYDLSYREKEEKEVGRSFYLNGGLAIFLAVLLQLYVHATNSNVFVFKDSDDYCI